MKAIKYILLVLWIGILFLPLSQNIFKYPVIKPLNGAFIPPKKPLFNISNWLSGNYQDSLDAYAESNAGYRPVLVRLRNQIDYTVFKRSPTNNILIGKNHQLFEGVYITKYYGEDTLNQSNLKRILPRLRFLQDTLGKENKLVMVVLAPGKAHFMPENIPCGYDSSNMSNSDYNVVIRLLNQYKINFIDFNSYFVSIKNKTEHPLFTPLGIHWTVAGASMAADSMTQYMKRKLDIPIVSYDVSKGFSSATPMQDDDDLYTTLNLLLPPKPAQWWYPYTIVDTTTGIKPGVLVIADSYYWRIIGNWFPHGVYSNDFSYWYYGHTAWPESSNIGHDVLVGTMNLKDEIERRQVIVFLDGEANYVNIGHGLIDKLYEVYNPK